MEFITIPAEQTTAITDAILALESLLLAGYLQRFISINRIRTRCWQILLMFTAIVSILGAAAHGIEMSKAAYEWLWKPILLFLGLVVANIILAAVLDIFGPQAARRSVPRLFVLAVGFLAVTFIPGVTFLVFILYEAAGMLFGLICYGRLAWRRRLPGAGVIAAGITLQIAAAAVQAGGPFQLRIVWIFDHNGVFHLIGMIATFIMIIGVAKGFRRRTISPQEKEDL